MESLSTPVFYLVPETDIKIAPLGVLNFSGSSGFIDESITLTKLVQKNNVLCCKLIANETKKVIWRGLVR